MSSNIKICPVCGAANEPDAFYCGYCGAKLVEHSPQTTIPVSQPTTPEYHCPNCGALVKPEWLFCKKCGQPLKPPAGTAVSDNPAINPQASVQQPYYQPYTYPSWSTPSSKKKKIHSFSIIWVFYGIVLLLSYVLGSANLFVVTLGSTLPAVLILFYFYQKDTYKEPGFLVLKVFLTGVLIAIPAYIIELGLFFIGLSVGFYSIRPIAALYQAFVIAALTEEYLKYWAMKVHIFKSPDFDEPRDGIVYGVAAALGFAAIENFLYALSNMSNLVLVLIMRGLLSVPIHSVMGAFSGYYLSKWFFYESKLGKKYSTFNIIKVSILIHGTFNFFLFLLDGTPLVLLGLIIGFIILGVSVKMLFNKIKELDNLPQIAPVTQPQPMQPPQNNEFL